jgi:hypothetical protein
MGVVLLHDGNKRLCCNDHEQVCRPMEIDVQPKMEAYNKSSIDSKTRWPSLEGDFKSRRRHNLWELGREATQSVLARAITHSTTAQP